MIRLIDLPNLVDRFYLIIKLFFRRFGKYPKSHGRKITFLKITPLIQPKEILLPISPRDMAAGNRRTGKVTNGASPIRAHCMALDRLRDKGPETPNRTFSRSKGQLHTLK